MNLYISIATKISISLFLVVFLFSAFYFLFSANEILAGEDSTNIKIACEKYEYPWCKDTAPGIAPLVGQFYKIALGLAGASALGVLIYGAILWTLSGAVTSKQDAMEWISGALWGLGLLLGAYLILWTINPQLVALKEPGELMPSIKIEQGPAGGTLSPALEFYTTLSQEQAKNRLTGMGVGVKEGVNLGGIKKPVIDEIAHLAGWVNSDNIYITSGTEGGGTIHQAGIYSHGTGYKIDIRSNTLLNNVITTRFKELPPRQDGTKLYESPTGGIYAFETKGGPHWDVVVKPSLNL